MVLFGARLEKKRMVISPASPHAVVDMTFVLYPKLAYKLEKRLLYQPESLCVNPHFVSK